MGPHQVARWDWLFTRNPADPRLFFVVAEASSRLAGQYALLPVKMHYDGQPSLGLLSLDTATDPEYQRQGIFVTLATRMYEEVAAEVPVVFGFPNRNSVHGFVSKLDWHLLEPFPLFVRPLNSFAPLLRHPWLRWVSGVADALVLSPMDRTNRSALAASGQGLIEPFDEFGPWADDVWRANADLLGTCTIRDRTFLNWRFVSSPFSYDRVLVRRGGLVRGFAVVGRIAGRPDAFLMELLTTDPGDRATARILIADAIERARAMPASKVSAIFTRRHPHARSLRAAGFFRVPRRFRPEWAFGVRTSSETAPPGVLSIDGWHLSGADLDFV